MATLDAVRKSNASITSLYGPGLVAVFGMPSYLHLSIDPGELN